MVTNTILKLNHNFRKEFTRNQISWRKYEIETSFIDNFEMLIIIGNRQICYKIYIFQIAGVYSKMFSTIIILNVE